jgi:hypothetical protein
VLGGITRSETALKSSEEFAEENQLKANRSQPKE